MEEGPLRRVWDLPVRIVHWLLVIGIAGSYATHKLGVAYFNYHLWFGYLVVVLAAFRILWGFVGTRHARFASFLRGPRATKQRPFVRDGRRPPQGEPKLHRLGPVDVGQQSVRATSDRRAGPRRVTATHLSRVSPSGTRSC